MRDLHEYQRERLLDAAIAAGKFGEGRRAHYAALYDADPVGTAHWIGVLAAVPAVATVPTNAHRALLPEFYGTPVLGGLAPTVAHVRPAAPAEVETTPEAVEGWTDALFPETAEARRVEAQVQTVGATAYPRIMSDGNADG
jgi:hypothetical protein